MYFILSNGRHKIVCHIYYSIMNTGFKKEYRQGIHKKKKLYETVTGKPVAQPGKN